MSRAIDRLVNCVVTSWFGTFLLVDGSVVGSASAPMEPAALAERARIRREGRTTPEEDRVARERTPGDWLSRDRRLVALGIRYDAAAPVDLPSSVTEPDRGMLATALLAEAERALVASWDPSVHVQEAVRAATDLDRVRNLIGERLGSWVSHDLPDLDPGDHARAARAASEGATDPSLGPADPALLEARRSLGELYQSVADARRALQEAVAALSPVKTPNLNALLGPELSARLVAQAGGLDRMARLPSSTVQVLGAERAFFEHLRGRAPPPRHGLLFLHPSIQSAPRSERGKLARALAGKVAIAARLDHEARPVDPTLRAAYEARKAQVEARRGRPRKPARARDVTPST
jgi:nucleolar protein 56